MCIVMEALTEIQQSVVDFVQSRLDANLPAPTFREIAAKFRWKSVRAAQCHVQTITKKGWFTSQRGKSRSLRVNSPLAKFHQRTVKVPILGDIPAGFPRDGVQEPEGYVTMDLSSIGGQSFSPERFFAVRVVGDSMIGRHILPGDIVVLDRRAEPRDGQIVAALIDGERTLKTFVVKGRKTFLQAENPNFPNLHPSEGLVIQGVFKQLIRRAKD